MPLTRTDFTEQKWKTPMAIDPMKVKAGPQCGAVFDHLFIYEKDVDRAEDMLEYFIDLAKKDTVITPGTSQCLVYQI